MSLPLINLTANDVDKIAAAFSSMSSSFMSKTTSSSASKGFGVSKNIGFQNLKKRDNLQSTIPKARNKADVQPLYKDTGDINKPTDLGTVQTNRSKQESLGHLKDQRLLSPRTHLHNGFTPTSGVIL